MKGIAYWIEKHAEINPNRIAIISETEEISYKELNGKINQTVAILVQNLRVQKGDRIAILSQNRVEYILLLFAIAKIQCVAVPLNIRLTENELVYQLNDSGTTLLFAEEPLYSLGISLKKKTPIQNVVEIEALSNEVQQLSYAFDEINEDEPYIICYTSGTTGKPKGAVLTQSNMFWNAINNAIPLDLTSNDRSIVLLPLFHIGGIGLFAFPTIFVGGTVVIPGKFDPEKVLAMIEQYQVTIVMGVPSIHHSLLNSPTFEKTNLKSVRWFYNGGAPCPHSIIKAFLDGGFLFGQGFGMTETSPTVFLLLKEDARRKIGSIGKPALYCEFMLVDTLGNQVGTGEVGELIVRGPNVMKEYWQNPEATKETIKDGWLYTGDLAYTDEEGFVFIAGRKKEMIISGGENIYPLEVEQVIGKLDEVSECAVVGTPDNYWGEVPVAFVVLKDGHVLKEDDITEHCKRFLGKYKVPKRVQFLNELPKNATGKIQKTLLAIKS
ncbi:o-succinylbenzoate--CoA ligase [Bacillus massilinigeriensis]|uniref:o-succinylbenzoate--CoA ligase n=1 Tax=Bacillus massilionigeriensis TaxID=1805475 RepID=UPI00096AF637|nr:o-succinylbenzoate--CoA ligase [Bacillus massilionigeriensis]